MASTERGQNFQWNPPQPATSCTAFCRRLLPSPRTTTCDPAGPGTEGEGGMSLPTPPHQLGVWGSALRSSSGVQGEVPAATWRFITFYRLTKPLLVSILLILNFKKCRSQQRGPWPKWPNDTCLLHCVVYPLSAFSDLPLLVLK